MIRKKLAASIQALPTSQGRFDSLILHEIILSSDCFGSMVQQGLPSFKILEFLLWSIITRYGTCLGIDRSIHQYPAFLKAFSFLSHN
jgi:hypothetical protein